MKDAWKSELERAYSPDHSVTWSRRSKLVVKFSWAIPSAHAMMCIASLRMPIVEIGAGTGYWAKCLSEWGVDVIAYDVRPYRNGYVDGRHATVFVGGSERAAEHPDRALLLVWPEYDTPMASNTLKAYLGETVIYVGEHRGGCTGDDSLLENFWDLIETVEIPKWHGIHDALFLYKRKRKPLLPREKP